MTVLESIENSLDATSTFFDFLEEDAKGTEGKDNPLSELMDKIKEVFSTVGKAFTAFDQKGFWDKLTKGLEFFEELFKLLSKFAGPLLGFLLKIFGKLITGTSKAASAIKEAAEEPG